MTIKVNGVCWAHGPKATFPTVRSPSAKQPRLAKIVEETLDDQSKGQELVTQPAFALGMPEGVVFPSLDEEASTRAGIKEENREKKATKSDDAGVPLELWTDHFVRSSKLLEDPPDATPRQRSLMARTQTQIL